MLGECQFDLTSPQSIEIPVGGRNKVREIRPDGAVEMKVKRENRVCLCKEAEISVSSHAALLITS